MANCCAKWQPDLGGNIDETLLNLHLLQAAAERQKRYIDSS
jgi:hypothetical protein